MIGKNVERKTIHYQVNSYDHMINRLLNCIVNSASLGSTGFSKLVAKNLTKVEI